MIIIYHHDHFIIKDLYAYDRLVKNCIGGISFGVWISSYGYKAVKKGRLHPQMLWFFCKAKLAIRNLPYLQSFLPSLFATESNFTNVSASTNRTLNITDTVWLYKNGLEATLPFKKVLRYETKLDACELAKAPRAVVNEGAAWLASRLFRRSPPPLQLPLIYSDVRLHDTLACNK